MQKVLLACHTSTILELQAQMCSSASASAVHKPGSPCLGTSALECRCAVLEALGTHCREPPGEGLMCELLWSDPQPQPGRSPSKRGVGVGFGVLPPCATPSIHRNASSPLICLSHA